MNQRTRAILTLAEEEQHAAIQGEVAEGATTPEGLGVAHLLACAETCVVKSIESLYPSDQLAAAGHAAVYVREAIKMLGFRP